MSSDIHICGTCKQEYSTISNFFNHKKVCTNTYKDSKSGFQRQEYAHEHLQE